MVQGIIMIKVMVIMQVMVIVMIDVMVKVVRDCKKIEKQCITQSVNLTVGCCLDIPCTMN